MAYTVQIENRLKAQVQDGPLASPRPLTLDEFGDDDLAWSRDGQSIYLASDDRGENGPAIWSAPVAGGSLARGDLMIANETR